MMKVNEFLNKLTMAYNEKTHYQSGGWGKWNGNSWGFDCVCLIKAILWGWNNDKSKPRGGGAVYGSNGVGDIGEATMIKKCNKVSNDFSNLTSGEVVYMDGHIGTYIGNNIVIEATVNFGGGVVKSKIDKYGNRTSLDGKQKGGKWLKHGFLPYIEYENAPETYFIAGKDYTLLYAKCLRYTPKLCNNIVKVKDVDAWTRAYLTSNKANANAMLKVGFTMTPLQLVYENGRIWGSYGNCFICMQNADGTKQVKKVN